PHATRDSRLRPAQLYGRNAIFLEKLNLQLRPAQECTAPGAVISRKPPKS
ncbi:hypothetical protein A2U01_0059276, partial [Trifolium medium]|nr:hypothetical protein [Trifolium medium]